MTEKRSREDRRAQIVQAALDLVGEGGVRAVNMGAVARRVGLVPSALYRHFASKEALLDALLESFGERLTGNVTAVAGETANHVEQLRRLLDRHMRLIRENESLPRLVFSEEIYGGTAERRERLRQIMHSYVSGVAGIVAAGQETGTIRRGADPLTVAVLFLGLVQPPAILWHLSGGHFDVTRHAARAWDLFRTMLEPEVDKK